MRTSQNLKTTAFAALLAVASSIFIAIISPILLLLILAVGGGYFLQIVNVVFIVFGVILQLFIGIFTDIQITKRLPIRYRISSVIVWFILYLIILLTFNKNPVSLLFTLLSSTQFP